MWSRQCWKLVAHSFQERERTFCLGFCCILQKISIFPIKCTLNFPLFLIIRKAPRSSYFHKTFRGQNSWTCRVITSQDSFWSLSQHLPIALRTKIYHRGLGDMYSHLVWKINYTNNVHYHMLKSHQPALVQLCYQITHLNYCLLFLISFFHSHINGRIIILDNVH